MFYKTLLTTDFGGHVFKFDYSAARKKRGVSFYTQTLNSRVTSKREDSAIFR